MADITMRHVRKSFGHVDVIKGVDLDIRNKEFVVFVGPSGCGKSTLLRLVAGLEDITSGTLMFDGEEVNDLPPAERGIAMVFQSYALYPHMSVYENMAFGLKLAKLGKEGIDERVREAARILQIEHLLDRKPKQLSGGQRQRVAIGRAIVRDARLFLFDEPLSNLDAKLRDEMRSEIKRLHQELGKTMVYVTHDQVEAMTLADRIVLLRDGLIEQEGAPLDLFERPRTRFVAGFLGSPSMNFLRATLEGSGQALAVRCGEACLKIPPARADGLAARAGQEVVFGVRPEHISRAHGPARAGLAPLDVTIDLIQPTGSRTYATFLLAGTEVMAELQAHDVERPGERLQLHVDMNRAVLIDPDTELVL